MTERQTPAIVLTVREYGEADLMVNFLTPGYGPLTGIAKHARKSRRRFAHCLEPLSRVVFFLSPVPAGTGVSAEGRAGKSFPALRRDLKRLGAAVCWPRWRVSWPVPRRPIRRFSPPWRRPSLSWRKVRRPIPCCPPSWSTFWAWGATGPASTIAGSAARSPPRP